MRLIDADNLKKNGLCGMNRYDHYTDSFISDDIDMRSYMLGYLQGCEDSLKKFNELNKPQFSIPLREPYMRG